MRPRDVRLAWESCRGLAQPSACLLGSLWASPSSLCALSTQPPLAPLDQSCPPSPELVGMSRLCDSPVTHQRVFALLTPPWAWTQILFPVWESPATRLNWRSLKLVQKKKPEEHPFLFLWIWWQINMECREDLDLSQNTDYSSWTYWPVFWGRALWVCFQASFYWMLKRQTSSPVV